MTPGGNPLSDETIFVLFLLGLIAFGFVVGFGVASLLFLRVGVEGGADE